ncbi:hypothetical protein [Billgrantia zhangzhouensis]|uniref:hypothetical protein n=1 Tax=Billgrantia zhangzhouensis TaxID=2733481 RepID=UPI001F36C5F3|nr:hypothetical protein [Halomonas zhangzhouensis]
MKIGRETIPRTAISTSGADTILVHGKDLSGELVGRISFNDYFLMPLDGQPTNDTMTQR